MICNLKDCPTGDNACYNTTVEITEKNGAVTFKFVAENTKYYSPYHGYNKVHSLGGDVVEVFIGSDSERINYYEIELSPENELMLAKIRYNGDDEFGKPVLDLDFIDDCFVKSSVVKTAKGYIAEISFLLDNIRTGDNDIYFNAYRIETDGGVPDKHLFALSPTMRRKFHTPKRFVLLKNYIEK